MKILLVLFGVGALLELGLHLGGWVWRGRKVLAAAALLLTAFATGALVVWQFNVWSVLIAVVSLYRIFNHLRVIEGRMHERYLQRATLRTSLVLVALQAALALGWLAWHGWHQTGHVVWSLMAGVQLAVALVLLASTTRRLRRTGWPAKAPALSDAQLPTLSVAIPARNETQDLQACLESLVRCNYPKLEILVLDDCSQMRRTPEIIRGFAQDGVRFIRGEDPKPTWLPKNQAYDHLLRESSGEFVLFCGVDVRFGPDSLRQLVAMVLHKNKAMLSLLPWRADEARRRFAVVQAMRYCWELVPPRRLFNRPPVLSTCWIANRDALARAGGFAAVARSIVPEAHFAREFSKTDTYSFMRASAVLGIQSTKPAKEQYDTAIRMRYPQLRRRPENVLLLSLAYIAFILSPVALAVLGFWVSIGPAAQLLAAATAVLNSFIYFQVVVATRTGSRWVGLVALPFGVLSEVALLHASMYQYEFSTVDWKGRNVCVPTMHVIPHLPPMV